MADFGAVPLTVVGNFPPAVTTTGSALAYTPRMPAPR